MIKSETLGALATALSAAQGEFDAAVKDTANPFFKSKYADLSSVVEATRPALSKHGLSIIQLPRSQDGCIQLETILLHKSGEFIGDTLALPVSKQDAQGYGSAMTYARRYGWMAVTGIAPEDDDGNAAVRGATPAAANANGRKSSAQAKRDGDDTAIKGRLSGAITVEEIDAVWSDIQENTMPTLPIAWEQGMQDFYETQREALKDQAA